MKYKKRQPFKRSNNHRNSNESFGNGSMNNGSRVTGSLSTVLEKYKNLAKDATSSGDYVGAENYMQHADHFTRVLNEQENLRKIRQEENKALNLDSSVTKINTVDQNKEETTDNNGSTVEVKKNDKTQSEAS